jgi:hypothetical protein
MATGRREIALILDGSGADEMGDALIAAPLSSTLKRIFLRELFSDPRFHAGPEGITYFPGATAPDTGDFRIKAQLGRAGIAFARAFGALRACALNEVGDSCHVTSPEIEVTSQMIEAGRRELLAHAPYDESSAAIVVDVLEAMLGAIGISVERPGLVDVVTG